MQTFLGDPGIRLNAMALKNTTQSYGTLTRFLHWVTAALIVVLVPLGLYMHGLDNSPLKISLYGIHKSLGFFVLVLTAIRVVWTITNPKPALLGELTPVERKLAVLVHGLFYVFLIFVPLVGWLMSSAKGYPVSVYGWFTLPDMIDKNESWAKWLGDAHELGAWGLVGLIVLHLAGVWKHEGVYKDDTLSRMMPRRPAWLVALVGLMVLGFAPAIGKTPHNGLVDSGQVVAIGGMESHDEEADEGGAQEHAHDQADKNGLEDNRVSRWVVDYDNSSLVFVATMQGTEIQGRFLLFDADIRFDPDALEDSRADVRIDMESVDTGDASRDSQLRGAAWFATEDFKTSRFETTSFKKIDARLFEAEGMLTIRDVERPITLPFTLDYTRGADGAVYAVMRGELMLNRLDFGVGRGQWSDASSIGADVRVVANIRAELQNHEE